MIEVIAQRDGRIVARLYVRDPQLDEEALDNLAVWGADYSTLNGQNYPFSEGYKNGDGPREGFVS